jgi:hypothetical protein
MVLSTDVVWFETDFAGFSSSALSTSLRGALATTRLRLLRKLRRVAGPPKRLRAKAEAIQLSCWEQSWIASLRSQ